MSAEAGSFLDQIWEGLFPLAWPAQAALIIFLAFLGILAYRAWKANNSPTPYRYDTYMGSLPHERVRLKADCFGIDKRVDPEFEEDLARVMLQGYSPPDQKALEGPDATYQVEGGPVLTAQITREQQDTLATVFKKNKHMYYYLGRCMPTEGQHLTGWVIIATPASIDSTEFSVPHRTFGSIFRGYHTQLRELGQSHSDGFVIRNPGLKWKSPTSRQEYPISAFVYYELTKVKDGTTVSAEKFETIRVSMSMFTQLQVIVKSWQISKYNERLAREMGRLVSKLQRFNLILSRRNAELVTALGTEAYDERDIRKQVQHLHALIAAGIMFVGGAVLPEIFRRNIEGYSDSAFEMLAMSIAFVAVMIAYWWKKSRNN